MSEQSFLTRLRIQQAFQALEWYQKLGLSATQAFDLFQMDRRALPPSEQPHVNCRCSWLLYQSGSNL